MSLPVLNVALTLEAPERVADGMGGARIEWRALGVLYAELRPAAAREVAGQTGQMPRLDWRVLTRAFRAGDPRRPQPGQRFRMGARLLRIEAVAEFGPGGRYLQSRATEEVLP
ncbi:MAG: head-tail adaptor protein [Paracoccus sp. (in: a-proteobacteria)]|nr:head-tail adaptor protein [Paracoccus sp. (in: a-proteobacteria)]